ncbi:MAG TPA: triple tyrosine motif-containing protein, partial [Bacteroidia bacterium]|nr:triple tyrosine motif-containing protein [Bacteroidia bacterium]
MDLIKNIFRKRIAFAVLLFHIVVVMKGQQPFLYNYSVSEGLPGFEIYSMIQDSKGLLWFATDAGASCYDGYHFKNFTSRDGLPDNTIFGFYEDWRGRIWFRSYNGLLSYYDGKKIVNPPVNASLKKLLNGKITLSVYVDRGDTIWLGWRGGPSRIRIMPDFTTIDPHVLPTSNAIEIQEIESGRFIINSDNTSSTNSSIRFFPFQSSSPLTIEGVCDPTYISCSKFSDGEIFITVRNGHYIIKGKDVQYVKDSLLVIRNIISGNNRYWSCLAGHKGVQLIQHSPSGDYVIKHFLDGYSVTDCLEDREGGIWFTTLEKGVFYMPYPGVEELSVSPFAPGEKITALTTLQDGRLISATTYGKIFMPSFPSWNPAIAPGDQPNYISCLFSDRQTFALTSTSNSLLFDQQTGKYIVVHDSTGSTHLSAISGFNDQYLCGVSIRTIYLVDRKTGLAKIRCNSLPDRMRCICKGRGDTLWLGGLTGLWMLAPGKTPVSMSALDTLLGQRIDFLYYDSAKNRLWMSSKGVGLLLKEGQHVHDFNNLRPQIAATCRALSADEEGNLWIATNAGAFCVSELPGGKFSSREFSIRNGLSSNDIVGIKHIGDTLWIAASDRIIRFCLSNYPHNLAPPPLLMRSITVDGHEIDPSASPDKFQFNYGDNTIVFSFIGISYKSFGQVHYRFRLIGADSSWKETQSNEAVFYKLPPGEYRFSLFAFNNDGISQPKPLEFSFIILPPFW